MRSKEAWARAADCAARAEEAVDERTRFLFNKLRDSWIRVAKKCETAEALERDAQALTAIAAQLGASSPMSET